MPDIGVVVIAASFLTVALICSLTSISHLEAISQPSQGGGYPNYEPTTGATPDCLVTPKKYEYTQHTGAPPPPDTLRTYSILECCKTAFSGPNLQTQTTNCANYYEWKDQYYRFEHPPYGPPIDYISSWGLLPPYHVYLKNSNNGGESISPPPVNTTGPGECMQGCGCIGCLAPGGNATNPGNNTLPTLPITKVHNPASPGLFSSVGNATNPGNNTGTLPPGSIFKVPPGNTSSNNIGNTTNPGNITGTLPPNVFTLAGNGTNTSNNTGPVLPGLVKPTGNLSNALPSTGNNSGPLPPPGSIVNLTRNATHEPPG